MSIELDKHITEKIEYHDKLRLVNEATEDYIQCAYHRNEIERLERMLSKPPKVSLIYKE